MNKIKQARGVTLLYSIFVMIALMGLVSLGVDFGRVEVAKTELQRAADSAARYGASGLSNIINGESAAFDNAVAAAADNTVDGTTLVLNPSDVQLVIWNSSNRTYTVTTDPTLANGVRVNPVRSKARGNAIQTLFGKIIGVSSCDITNAVAIATITNGTSSSNTVLATGNPFLAGMPAGSQASVGSPSSSVDVAGTAGNPKQSPMQANLTITPGQAISFDGVNGGANNQNAGTVFDADGNIWDCEANYTGNDNKIGNMTAPLNSLVGIFLDNTVPTSTSTPNPSLVDYSTTASRSFQSLSPKLKQIFFIGDGRSDDGSVQTFIPPTGATRLFLATWDGYHWGNNIGSFTVGAHLPGTVSLVK